MEPHRKPCLSHSSLLEMYHKMEKRSEMKEFSAGARTIKERRRKADYEEVQEALSKIKITAMQKTNIILHEYCRSLSQLSLCRKEIAVVTILFFHVNISSILSSYKKGKQDYRNYQERNRERGKKKTTKIQYSIIKILGFSSDVSICEKLYMNQKRFRSGPQCSEKKQLIHKA